MTDNLKSSIACSSDEDLPLVLACKQGDISAFEALLTKYDRKLFRIAQNITHNPEDAEEVVQTAFFKAYQNLGRSPGKRKVLNMADSHRLE